MHGATSMRPCGRWRTRAAARPITAGRVTSAADEEEPVIPLDFDVTIEIPAGSRNKYEIDHETGRVMLDRVLFTTFVYPTDYGFFENTLGLDRTRQVRVRSAQGPVDVAPRGEPQRPRLLTNDAKRRQARLDGLERHLPA